MALPTTMTTPKKTKEQLLSALATNLPIVQHASNAVSQQSSKQQSIVDETEQDYNFARDHIKKLIDTSDHAISTLHDLATDSEHPRTYEVLAGLLKTSADMNGQLLTLQRERKRLVCDQEQKNIGGTVTTTNNSIFVGTTAELQKLIKNQGLPVVDVA